jgi:ATP phosphoribosyltransferase
MRRLTLALAKGRLLDGFVAWSGERGLQLAPGLADAGRSLVVETAELRLLLLKDADVPVYVEQGVADCGVVGLDQILERDADVLRLLRLPFGRCRLSLITRQGESLADDGRPLVIARSTRTWRRGWRRGGAWSRRWCRWQGRSSWRPCWASPTRWWTLWKPAVRCATMGWFRSKSGWRWPRT